MGIFSYETPLNCPYRRDGMASKEALGKKKEEELANGIAVDDATELETLTDEITDREKLAEESRDSEGALKKIEADKMQGKCEKRPWSGLERPKKDLQPRVSCKGSRPNEGGVEMMQ